MNSVALPKIQSRSGVRPLSRLGLRLPPAKVVENESASVGPLQQQSALHVQIESLKLLAVSLMRQIDSLEEQVLSGAAAQLDLQGEVRRFEAELIRTALIRTKGKQRRAARLLGMKVTTLNTKIKKYQITVPEDDDGSMLHS